MFVILLGPPGAGKGTQAELLAASLGVPKISTGELFREAMAQGTALGQDVATYIDRGQLVPDETTMGVLRKRLENPDAEAGAVLDGFPRTIKQAEQLDCLLDERGSTVDRVIDVDVPTAEIVRRLSGRWTCRNCNASYHEQFAPPKQPGLCDRCGGALYQRSDDRPEAITVRLDTYRQRTEPLVDYYKKALKLRVVAGNQPKDVVTRALISAVTDEALGN